ncbi:MAG: cadherin-like domain-containing protein [Anaerolineae bacterium]|nr:cadherin-like domain-containing protein [Anaerolineae bacterium]
MIHFKHTIFKFLIGLLATLIIALVHVPLISAQEPSAMDDAATTPQDITVTISPLVNDSGSTLSVSAIGSVVSGTTSISGATQIVYTPTVGFRGTEVFTYAMTDGSDVATATIRLGVGMDAQVFATNIGLSGDDYGTQENIPIGFNYDFFGSSYNMLGMTTNGFLQFNCGGGNCSSTYSNEPIPNSSISHFIAPFWDDLVMQCPSGLYKTIGQSPNRIFIAQWTDMYSYGTGAKLGTFQAWLYENSQEIIFQYPLLMGANEAFGNSATVGLNAYPDGVQYSYNTVSLSEKQPIRWVPGSGTFTYTTQISHTPLELTDVTWPSKPGLTSPVSEADNVPHQAIFTWAASEPAADQYKLLVATDANFANIVLNQTVYQTVYTATLDYDTDYYWRVVAQKSNGCGSAYSDMYHFKTSPHFADAGTPQSVQSGVLVQLDGSGSDALVFNPPLTGYSWAQTSGSPTMLLSDSTVVSPTFTSADPGVYIFTLTVTDSLGLVDTDPVMVTVNNPPIAVDDVAMVRRDDNGDLSILASQPVTIPVLLNDTDPDTGNNSSLTVSAVGTGSQGGTVAINANNRWVNYTPAAAFSGVETFTYTVRESGSLTDTAAVTVTVVNGDGGGSTTPGENGGETIIIPSTGFSSTITVTIQIPAEVLAEKLTLVYDKLDTASGPPPQGFKLAGVSFTLDAYLNHELQPGHIFTTPITLTIQYGDEDVAYLPQGEESLELRYWDAGKSNWSSDGITVIDRDTVNNRLTVTIAHLTEFGLFGKDVQNFYLPIISQKTFTIPDLVITDLTATGNSISVMVKNQGNTPVSDAFWVDVYFNPTQTPALNKRWSDIAPAGAVWGVTIDIPAGDSLTLTVGDSYFDASKSSTSFPVGAQVYGNVDSVNYFTGYGAVQESNESNNLFGPVTSTAASGAPSVASQSDTRVLVGLPQR